MYRTVCWDKSATRTKWCGVSAMKSRTELIDGTEMLANTMTQGQALQSATIGRISQKSYR